MIDQITIIFVNYKLNDLLLKNLKNLNNFKTIIVDNDSKSLLLDKLKDLKNITYIRNSTNIGEGAAANIALAKVKTKYTLYLNPDTFMNLNDIVNLQIQYNTYSNIGVIAPIHIDKEGNYIVSYKLPYFTEYKVKRNSIQKKFTISLTI